MEARDRGSQIPAWIRTACAARPAPHAAQAKSRQHHAGRMHVPSLPMCDNVLYRIWSRYFLEVERGSAASGIGRISCLVSGYLERGDGVGARVIETVDPVALT